MSACHVVIRLLEAIKFLTLQIFLLKGISTSYQNLNVPLGWNLKLLELFLGYVLRSTCRRQGSGLSYVCTCFRLAVTITARAH